MAQKRKAISLETKYQVVSKRQRGEKPSYLIKEYGLSSSTVSTIFKNQEKIIAEYESNLEENGIKRNKDSMRIKEPTYQDIDSGVEEWFKQTIAQTNVVITYLIPMKQLYSSEPSQNSLYCKHGRFRKVENL